MRKFEDDMIVEISKQFKKLEVNDTFKDKAKGVDKGQSSPAP